MESRRQGNGWRQCGLAFLLLWLFLPTFAVAQPPPKRLRVRESATLETDSLVVKKLSGIRELMADGQWGPAIDTLQQIAEEQGKLLIPFPDKITAGANSAGLVNYVNVAEYCQGLLCELPAEGRQVYRKRFDPQAQRRWNAWLQTGELGELQTLVRTAFLSSFAERAMLALGEEAWSRGDFSLARSYWDRLLPGPAMFPPRLPDPTTPAANLRGRLILCSLLEGQRERAERELTEFRQQHAGVTGQLAGRTGVLSEILEQEFEQARHWPPRVVDAEVASFGFSNHRQKRLPTELDLGPQLWSVPLTPNRLELWPRVAVLRDAGPLTTFPVVLGSTVFVADQNAIRAWNVLTGEPAWPNGTNDPAVIYPTGPLDEPPPPGSACVGVPRYTLTLHDGRLYARMGSPVTSAARDEARDQHLRSELICLDVTKGQGKLLWKIDDSQLPPENPPWRFEGTPVVEHGRIFAVLSRRRTQLELQVACWDAETAALLWRRGVCHGRPHLEAHHNRVSHLLLTVGDQRLFLSTDIGAVVALDQATGRLDWAMAYESLFPESSRDVFRMAQSALIPCLYHDGRIFAAPNDSQRLFCLAADSGKVLWHREFFPQQPLPERISQLIGVADGTLILSGKALWGLDVTTGKNRWQLAFNEPEEQGYGHGLLAGSSVYWPTREVIFVVDQQTGKLVRRFPLMTSTQTETGGNLAVSNGLLLVAQPQKLTAFCQYAQLRQRAQQELSEHPNDPRAVLFLAKLAESDHQPGDALQGYQRVVQLTRATADQSAMEESLERWRQLILKQGLEAERLQAPLTNEWRSSLEELLKSPVSPRDRTPLLMQLARHHEQDQRSAKAIAAWQELLADSAVREQPDLLAQATAAIRRLVAVVGRKGYEPFETPAKRAWEQAEAARDPLRMLGVIEQFPGDDATTSRWTAWVTTCEQLQRRELAWMTLRRRMQTSLMPAEQAELQQLLVGSLERANYPLAVRALMNVDPHGDETSTDDHAARSLPAVFWQRGWSASYDGVALVPLGTPPSPEAAGILIGQQIVAQNWTWRSRDTGRVVWSVPATGTLQAAWHAEAFLVICSDRELRAVDYLTGRTAWQRSRPTGESLPRWQAQQLICFHPETGWSSIDCWTGLPRWSSRPAKDLSPHWTIFGDHLLFQIVKPGNSLIGQLRLSDGKVIGEHNGPREPWISDPATPDGLAWIWGISPNGVGISLAHPLRMGRIQRGIGWPYSTSAPQFLAWGGIGHVLADHQQLQLWPRADHEPPWRLTIATQPLTQPARQLALCDDRLAVADGSVLRGFQRGEKKTDCPREIWRTPLDAHPGGWQIVPWAGLLAVFPLAASTAADATRIPSAWHLSLIDPVDGSLVQQFAVHEAAKSCEFVGDANGALLITDQTLRTLNPLTLKAAE